MESQTKKQYLEEGSVHKKNKSPSTEADGTLTNKKALNKLIKVKALT